MALPLPIILLLHPTGHSIGYKLSHSEAFPGHPNPHYAFMSYHI